MRRLLPFLALLCPVLLAAQTIDSVTVPDSLVMLPEHSYQVYASAWSGKKTIGKPASWTIRDTTIARFVGAASGKSVTVAPWGVHGSTYLVVSLSGKRDSTKLICATLCGGAWAFVDSVAISPDSASVVAGAGRQFTATATLSDSTTQPASVTWSATGGTITADGFYTAGAVAGSAYHAIARTPAGLADTAKIVVTAAAPPAVDTGTTYFLADAEAGTMDPWSQPWGVKSDGTSPLPSNSTARAKHGTHAFKYEAVGSVDAHYSQTLSGGPTTTMGDPNGRYLTGYYSVWLYIDAGYTTSSTAWNMLLGWMTGVTGAPNPISHIGIETSGGVLQLIYYLKNCADGHQYTCPILAGYSGQGIYHMTASSPAGIVPFPRQQWVHVAVYYKMASTNGQVTIWQDGVKVMDLTAPTMNTLIGFSTGSNTAGDMLLQFGIYGGARTDGTQRIYADDFKVTNYRTSPTSP